MIYQHEARGADATITNAIDAHIDTKQSADGDGGDGRPGYWSLRANGTAGRQCNGYNLRQPRWPVLALVRE